MATAHLVGSVPLQDAQAVFTEVGSHLHGRLKRLPDGETGERSNWIRWQYEVLENCPQLTANASDPSTKRLAQFQLRDGASIEDVDLGNLGYSDAAIASYDVFAVQKKAGLIAADCRFQVSLPTPLAPMQFYVSPELRAALEPRYESALLRELNTITAAIPADQLAIQWDTAVEFGILEGTFASHLTDPLPDVLDRVVRLGNAVPPGIELGYHLCYGDSNHKHFCEPTDAGHLVDVANGINDGLERRLDWIHMPVPKERLDDAFYAPLASLQLSQETDLFLGLIHMTDGEDGTLRRIAVARRHCGGFGVATECGFGRRPAETVPPLLQLHASVADHLGQD